MVQCKRRLATLWFGASGALFSILIVQSILGKYGEGAAEAWSWFLPTLVPTLSLIVGVLVMDALKKGVKQRTVGAFLFNLSFWLSGFYLLTLGLTIFLQPFSEMGALELMKVSNLWIAPIQGLVTAAIAAFFVKSEGD